MRACSRHTTTKQVAGWLLRSSRNTSRNARHRARFCCRNHTTKNTNSYYDSQSGKHVPIHDEHYIYIYKHWSIPSLSLSNGNDAVPQWYKSIEDAELVAEDLYEMSKLYNGVFLSYDPIRFPRDRRNLEVFHQSIVPATIALFDDNDDDFVIFAPPPPPATTKQVDDTNTNPNTVVVLCNHLEASAAELRRYAQEGVRTAIGIEVNKDVGQTAPTAPPWEVANHIATLVDESGGGGDYLWISSSLSSSSSSSVSHDEEVIELCEELSYLDVTGPTMKSRLIVDCCHHHHHARNDRSNEQQDDPSLPLVEEAMSMGITKFVVYQQEQVRNCIQRVAEEQGKQLVHRN